MNNRNKLIELILHKNAFNSVKDGKFNKQAYGSRICFYSKDAISEGRGIIARELDDFVDDKFTHWTPNGFLIHRLGKYRSNVYGYKEYNLKLISTFVVDIDSKVDNDKCTISPDFFYDIKGILNPTAVLVTPHGWQVYYVLKTPCYVNKGKASIRVAKRISENLRKQLSQLFPIDVKCNHFGIARIPNTENLIEFTPENCYDFSDWLEWSKQFNDDKDKKQAKINFGSSNRKSNYKVDFRMIKQPWYRMLTDTKLLKLVEGCQGQKGRNTLIFTLALTNYVSGVDKKEAMVKMQIVNDAFTNPLDDAELLRTVNSAYSGRYRLPNREIIRELIHTYVDKKLADAKIFSPFTFYHLKKDRKERQQSHYTEWIADLAKLLDDKRSPYEVSIRLTTAELTTALGIPKSSLYDVKKKLNKNKNIKIKSVRGRNGGIILAYADRKALKILAEKKRAEKEQNSASLRTYLPPAKQDQDAITIDTTKLKPSRKPTESDKIQT